MRFTRAPLLFAALAFAVGILFATRYWFSPAWLAIAAILWRMGAKYVREPMAKGEIFSMYLVLTGIARFLIEFIRINPRSFFGMSNAQTASLVSVALGVALLLRLKSQSRALRKTAAA